MSIAPWHRDRAPDARQVRNRLSEAESMLGRAASVSGDRASRILAQVQASLGSAVDAVGELRDNAIDRARSAGRRADDYVSDNPWRVIGAAAALGFLAAVFFNRRR